MPVGFDQPRQHDHAVSVDDGSGRRFEVSSDRGDGTVGDMHVRIGKVARLVHCHDIGVADDE